MICDACSKSVIRRDVGPCDVRNVMVEDECAGTGVWTGTLCKGLYIRHCAISGCGGMIVVIIGVVVSHGYTATFEGGTGGAGTGQCLPSGACESNRECTFGTLSTYAVVRDAVFEATGYPLTCIDACSCTPSPTSRVSTLLSRASSDPTIYNNNSVCSNGVLMAGMRYITANYACDRVFSEAQVPLFQLCGTTPSGSPCAGRCTSQYEISVPLPACKQRAGPQFDANFVVGLMVCTLGVLWARTPGSLDVVFGAMPRVAEVATKPSEMKTARLMYQ